MDAAPDSAQATFEEVVGEVLEPVRKYLARRTDPTTAEDVLAEVLLVLWRRLEDIPESRLPWAYGIARHALANAARGARRQQRLAAKIAATDPPSEVAVEDSPAVDQVRTAVALLPERDAELLRLWAWEDLSTAEIAQVLAISTNAASIRLHRAREKLRTILRKQEPGPGHEPVNEGSRR